MKTKTVTDLINSKSVSDDLWSAFGSELLNESNGHCCQRRSSKKINAAATVIFFAAFPQGDRVRIDRDIAWNGRKTSIYTFKHEDEHFSKLNYLTDFVLLAYIEYMEKQNKMLKIKLAEKEEQNNSNTENNKVVPDKDVAKTVKEFYRKYSTKFNAYKYRKAPKIKKKPRKFLQDMDMKQWYINREANKDLQK